MESIKDSWKIRIHSSPEILGGKPVIKGTRISVSFILNLISNGATFEEIMDEYKDLSRDDIKACIAYAIHLIDLKEPSRLSA